MLAFIYLIAAVADTILLMACLNPLIISATCGVLLVAFIPGILQIVAGVKFIKGAKGYAG